jgi:hypothetical protein
MNQQDISEHQIRERIISLASTETFGRPASREEAATLAHSLAHIYRALPSIRVAIESIADNTCDEDTFEDHIADLRVLFREVVSHIYETSALNGVFIDKGGAL